jgi:hypothetical protein
MISRERKSQLRSAIAHHLEVRGKQDWKGTMDAFRDISSATFWREVAKIRDATDVAIEVVDQRPSPNSLPQLPCVSSSPREGALLSDFAIRIEEIIATAEFEQSQCVVVRDGRPRILDSSQFHRAQQRKIAAIELGAKYGDQLHMIADMNAFNEAIIHEIGKESLVAQLRIIRRLRALQTKTPHDDPVDNADGWSAYDGDTTACLCGRLAVVLSACEMSWSDLAVRLELDEAWVQCLKLGKQFLPTPKVVGLMCIQLSPSMRLNMDWLFSGRGNPLLPLAEDPEVCNSAAELSQKIREMADQQKLRTPTKLADRLFNRTAAV